MAYAVLGLGAIFVFTFHLGVTEKPPSEAVGNEPAFRSKTSWKKWFKRLRFYQVQQPDLCGKSVVHLCIIQERF